MEKELALKIINSRILVTKEGKFVAKVENVTNFRKENASGKDTIAVVNLSMMTKYHKEQALKAGSIGDFQGAVNQKMSYGIIEGNYVPTKGEVLDVSVVEKENKDGILSLFINSIIPIAAEKLPKISFSFEEETDGVDIAEDVPAFSSAKQKA